MPESNFRFLESQWSDIFVIAQKAERYAIMEPDISATLCRKVLEATLVWLFDHDRALQLPAKQQISINDLLWEPSFKKEWGREFGYELNIVRKLGNNAAHESAVTITANEAVSCVKYLFRFTSAIVRTYSEHPYTYQEFDESLIPTSGITISKKEIDRIEDEFRLRDIELQRRNAILSEKQEEIDRMKEMLLHYEEISRRNGEVIAPSVLSEKETRKLYIDVMLREAGWDILSPNVIEFPVQAVDEATGKVSNFKVDYVLWGEDGKPVAVIEAKRTTEAVEKGRRQAQNYADALEKKYGLRPVIYYTNGFDTFFWDDSQYPPRKVFGFLSVEELQRLMVRKHQRATLAEQKVNQSIANRYYQERAIRRVAERFENEHQRRALLVMATGTGKTRVSAAIVDMLTKAQWAKRILFLADRNALVSQSLKNYNEYLPNLSGIDLTKEEDQGSARVVFSTYQTIINRIDNDYRYGKRYYGVGHFDLIIIDEAHRSIYDKYGAIFEYFDALYLGLTATPKSETDRDTYKLFGHQQGEPTDAYEYDVAVSDDFLVPVKSIALPLKFPQEGIKYSELSEEEKYEWESKFYDPATGDIPEQVDSGAVNQWLFNQDTVDKVLLSLFEHGHKVEGDEKLGKTIIFAKNHRHAEFIFQRFYALYPFLNGKFAQIIDNFQKEPEGIIDLFKIPAKFPQVAISVDMLDTGIDVPEVVNLVFFKSVFSASKFWQMLGRGTRLCKELFGPDGDKKDFRVFDAGGVFNFFEQNPEGVIPGKAQSLSEKTFAARAELVYLLHSQKDLLPDDAEYQTSLAVAGMLQGQISGLDTNAFIVRQHLQQVEQYSDFEVWKNVGELDIAELREHIAPIIPNDETHEMVKRFDLFMVNLQLAILRSSKTQAGYVDKLKVLASDLLRKADNVPTIAHRKETLRAILQKEFWDHISVPTLEKVREEIRELSKLTSGDESKKILYTNFADELTGPIEVKDFMGVFGNFQSHYAKLKKIVQENANNLTIRRLHTNQPITAHELEELDRMLFEQSGLATHEDFISLMGEKPLGIFIRSILGMDMQSARAAFSSFLSVSPLNSIQIEFISDVVQQFSKNGKIDPEMLFEQPFTKFHESGVGGIFPLDANKIIQIVKETNERAVAG